MTDHSRGVRRGRARPLCRRYLCLRRHYARGLCERHYHEAHRISKRAEREAAGVARRHAMVEAYISGLRYSV